MSDETTSGADEAPPGGASSRPEPIKAKPLRHPWRWVGGAVIVVLMAMLVHTLVFSRSEQPRQTGSRFGWPVVGQYLFSPLIIKGAELTLELTVIAMVAGILLGITDGLGQLLHDLGRQLLALRDNTHCVRMDSVVSRRDRCVQ